MPPGPGAHCALFISTASVLAGDGVALRLTAGVGSVASAVALLAVFRNLETRRAALPSGGQVDVETSSL